MLEVVDPGLLLSLQDRGRPGLARLGVPPSGALDAWGHAAACILAGAPPDAATAELTLGGAVLLALETCAVALAGADLGAERDDGMPLAAARVHRIPAGARIRFTGIGDGREVGFAGARAYVALAGGITAERVAGSASNLASAGLGGFAGRPARAGDRLVPARRGDLSAVGRAWPSGSAPHPAADRGPVRVIAGPDLGHLPAGTLDAMAGGTWTVDPASDRMGLRLNGPTLEAGAEILSHPIVPGAVQVPASGQPIIVLADGPTLGGYPVAGVVPRVDLPRLGQLRPGDRLAFEVRTPDEARAAWRSRQATMAHVADTLRADAVWHRVADEARG